jgi:hypothetical protein
MSKQSTLTTLEDEPVNVRYCNKFHRKEQEKLSWNQSIRCTFSKQSVPVILLIICYALIEAAKRVIAALEKKLNRISHKLNQLR